MCNGLATLAPLEEGTEGREGRSKPYCIHYPMREVIDCLLFIVGLGILVEVDGLPRVSTSTPCICYTFLTFLWLFEYLGVPLGYQMQDYTIR